jgi:hypothetical protein
MGLSDAMIQYSSPVEGLFAQIKSVRPTSMSCPPNIWAGLYDIAINHAQNLHATEGVEMDKALFAGRQRVIQMFGGRMKGAVTGGAPTPKHHLEFAQQVPSVLLARSQLTGGVDSYVTKCNVGLPTLMVQLRPEQSLQTVEGSAASSKR